MRRGRHPGAGDLRRHGRGSRRPAGRPRGAAARMPPGSPSRRSPPGWWSTGSRRRGTGTRSSGRPTATTCAGKRIERLVAQTNFENEESAERFQRDLSTARHRRGPSARRGPARRHGHDRRHGARVGAGRGAAGDPGGGAAPAGAVGCRARWGSSAGRSTRSITGTSPSPRTRASRWGWSAWCSSRPPSPPHKPGTRPVTAAADRLAMVRLAVDGQPGVRGERRRGRAGRAVVHGRHAGRAARRRGSSTRGSSSRRRRWPASPSGRSRTGSSGSAAWRSSRGPGSRPWTPAGSPSGFPAHAGRVTFLPGPLLPISGSVVRRRAAVGRSVRYLVPDAVAAYLADHRLYQEPATRTDRT